VGAETLVRLAPQAGTRSEGDLLFREGDLADHAYVIEQGVLGLFSSEHSGSTTLFRRALHGDLVGEHDLLYAERRRHLGRLARLDWRSHREIFLAGQSHARSRLGDGTRFRRPPAPRS
jgi:CRP-like cAMP-binding protein